MALATPGLPPDHAAALQHRWQGACEDSDMIAESQMAETVSEAHALSARFSQERSNAKIHAPGLLRIGGSAYFVWADPPKLWVHCQRHVQVHRRTTSALQMSKQLLVQ